VSAAARTIIRTKLTRKNGRRIINAFEEDAVVDTMEIPSLKRFGKNGTDAGSAFGLCVQFGT
jgi:hypothetical protein